MNPAPALAWMDANQQHLTAELERLRRLLERRLEGGAGGQVPPEPAAQPLPDGTQPALDLLTDLFQLSSFERDLLLLAAGVELDSRIGPLVASLHGDPQLTSPTFGLAMAVLPEPHWNALAPSAPLRRWRLVEVGQGRLLTRAPLTIDERILHFLAGLSVLDERLNGYVTALPAPAQELVPSQRRIAERITAAWSRPSTESRLPVVQLTGGDAAAQRDIAAEACAQLGLGLYQLQASALPASASELASLRRLWEREALLGGSVLLIDCDSQEAREMSRGSVLARWVESQRALLMLSSTERLAFRCPLLTCEVARPSLPEQHQLWQAALGPAAAALDGRVEVIVSHFNLDAATIRQVAGESLQFEDASPDALAEALWRSCSEHTRPGLDELAQYIRPLATWDDLVLPDAQLDTLHAIGMHVRQRMQVYETWGFARRSARGLGISAMFSGASGTGKTMAAEVLANELKLDLYRIDLSQVVSKYIGETEKNLRRVFDAAEEGGAILLFDEADALFGKRSEVRDSHDRYANVEISYLLQRMEAYRGLAILTTNLKEAVDPAFLRRLRFVVHFPFPDAGRRGEIWRRIFPTETPTEGLDCAKLARLNITGGSIHNIAMYAAFLAADAREPVCMNHLKCAARVEFSKLERPVDEAELEDWA